MKSPWITLLIVALLLTASINTTTIAQEASEEIEWWEKPSLITFPERLVGVCYPWLVTEHFLINLATNETIVGVGGDSAESVESCGSYFVVKAAFGVYVFSKTGLIVDTIHLNNYLTYVGAVSDTLAVYDTLNSIVHVKLINTRSTALIPIQPSAYRIDYSFIQYIPVVSYSALNNGTMSYYLANPGTTRQIPGEGTGAIIAVGNRVFIERSGIVAIEIQDPVTLSYRELFYIPLPIRLSEFISVIGDYLLASSSGILVKVNINEKSAEFRKVETIGVAIPTPVGYFVPAARTTYVITESGIYPTPGYAVGRLNNAVFTNILRRDNTIVPAMWATTSSILVTLTPFDGMLYDGEYVIRLFLPPGSYRLPRNAVLNDGVRSIILSEAEVTYPPSTVSQEPTLVSNIKFYVSSYPNQYLPLDVFNNVNYVSSGAGRLVIIQPDKAVIYAGYGVSVNIPGVWLYGGIGDCIVLYDGASFRLYDYSGEPITSYSYYLIRNPDYVTCRKISVSDYAVEVYVNDYSEKITITRADAKVEPNPSRVVSDPRGVTAYITLAPKIEFAGVVVPVPPTAINIHISGMWASWQTSSLNILSIPDSAVFVLINPPSNITVYPINSELFAAFFPGENRVEILPYRAWFVQNCYIDVETNQEAEVFLNGKYVSTGPARIYVPCNTRVNVEARQTYHKPKSAELFVTGPMKVSLVPEPMIATVILRVLAPKGLEITSLTIRVDGLETVWNVGEAKKMVAKPTSFEVISYMPVDVCTKETYTLSLTEGVNTLTVSCRLVAPVLALSSKVLTSVEVYVMGSTVPFQTATVSPEAVSYIISPVGDVRIVSKPLVQGYVAKEFNMSVTEVKVYDVDVSPYPMSKIIVQSNVMTAAITVFNETGATVGTGIGSLELEVLPGKYMVTAQAEGYSTFSMPVEVPPGEAVTLQALLRKVEVEAPPPEPPLWERFEFQIIAVAAVVAAAVVVLLWRRRRAKAVAEELVKGEESA